MNDQPKIYRETDLTGMFDDNKSESVLFIDSNFAIRRFNRVFADFAARYTKVSPESARGALYWDFIRGSRNQVESMFMAARDSCTPVSLFDFKLRVAPGSQKIDTYWDSQISPVINISGAVQGLLVVADDLTPAKYQEPQSAEEIAQLKGTIRTLLTLREEDKKLLEQNMSFNIKRLIMPLLSSIDMRGFSPEQKKLIVTIKSNLDRVISPFSRCLSSPEYNLSAREIQVANLISEGLSTKDIAEILNLSSGSIDSHRNNIRKKLGLNKKKISLQAFLSSLI